MIGHIPLCISIFAITICYLSNQSHSVLCRCRSKRSLRLVCMGWTWYRSIIYLFFCSYLYFHFKKIFSKHYYARVLFEFFWLFKLYLSLRVLNCLISTNLTQTFFMIIIFYFLWFCNFLFECVFLAKPTFQTVLL